MRSTLLKQCCVLAVQARSFAMNRWCEQLTGLLEAKKAKLRELQAQLDKQHELELGDKVLSSPLSAAHALAGVLNSGRLTVLW